MNTRMIFPCLVLLSSLIVIVGCRTAEDVTASPGEPVAATAGAGPENDSSTSKPILRSAKAEFPDEILPAHFQAAIYEVLVPSNRLNSIDGNTLSKQASTVDSLYGALSKLGSTKILYRFDQPVNVFSESLTLGSSEPIVTGSRVTPQGNTINSISYQQVGAIIRLSGRTPPRQAKRKGPDVRLSLELSVIGNSDVEMVSGRKSISTRKLSLDHSEELVYGQPRVMLAIASNSADENQSPAVYVVRYVFNH